MRELARLRLLNGLNVEFEQGRGFAAQNLAELFLTLEKFDPNELYATAKEDGSVTFPLIGEILIPGWFGMGQVYKDPDETVVFRFNPPSEKVRA